MASASDTVRMQRLLGRMEPRLRARFEAVVRQVRGTRAVGELAALLDAGLVEEALSAVDAMAEVLAGEIVGQTVAAGQSTATFLNTALGSVGIVFDEFHPESVARLQATRFELVRGLRAQQREAIREALLEGARRGLNPRAQAREFRAAIGLTARQVAAVNNYRRLLREDPREALTRRLRDRRFDPSVIRAAETGDPLSRAQVAAMTERYRERFRKFRAETIARTEALRAVHEGSEMMFGQAIEAGVIAAEGLERRWNTARDERVRSSHRFMHGQIRSVGEPFLSGNGNLLRYPGDPNAPGSDTIQCRCVVGTTIEVPQSVQFVTQG